MEKKTSKIVILYIYTHLRHFNPSNCLNTALNIAVIVFLLYRLTSIFLNWRRTLCMVCIINYTVEILVFIKTKKGGRNNKTDTYYNHNKNKRVSITLVYEITRTCCFLPPSGSDTWSVKTNSPKSIIYFKTNQTNMLGT